MKAEIGLRQTFGRVGICVTLTVLWAALVPVCPHTNLQSSNLLEPPKTTLVPVHLPDLKNLEADVREQLSSFQNSLAALARNSSARDSELSEAYGTMGEVYQAYSIVSPAMECYVNASQLAPKDFRWIYLLAKLNQREGRIEDAIKQFTEASTLRPEYVAVPVNLGHIYLQLDRREDAKASYKQALKLEESAAAEYGLGQLELSSKNYSEALKYFEKRSR